MIGPTIAAFGEAAKPAALDQARNTDRQAAAALDVAAPLRSNGIVHLAHYRPSLRADILHSSDDRAVPPACICALLGTPQERRP